MSAATKKSSSRNTPNRQTNGAAVVQPINKRETLIELAIGFPGVGKTYAIIQEIKHYITDNPVTGKKGRQVIIFDTNSEPQYEEAFPKEIHYQRVNMRIKNKPECVRILPFNDDGSHMDDEQMRNMANYLANQATHCLLVLDDIDKYYRNSKGRDISKLFMGHRHLDQDVIITHQSLAPIETVEWQNANVIRLHKTNDSLERIAGRVTNYEALKIAQLIVEEQFLLAESLYDKGKLTSDQRKRRRSYFVYIDIPTAKITGSYSLDCFMRNAKKYLNYNKSLINEFVNSNLNGQGRPIYSRDQAIETLLRNLKLRLFNGKQE